LTHAHPDDYTVDWPEKVAGLVDIARDDREWYGELARTLVRPGDRAAVDVGCGGGGMTLALAAALGSDGVVVATDSAPEMLAAVAGRLDDLPAGRARVEFVAADLGSGVGPVRAALGRPADLVWASASVHHTGDQQAAVDALAGLLGAGGRLALAEGGLAARHLPWDVGVGEPGLELRLEAAHDRWFARMRVELPGSRPMPYGWTQALRRAGLVDVTTRTTLRERPVPLPERDRDHALDRLGTMVEKLRPTGLLDPADLAVWDRLLDPADEAWLGRRGDLQRLDARSVHVGVRPGV
jgi:SAM-dependent methyltransferase